MSDSDLSINCWILGDEYDRALNVAISGNKDVYALQKAIKAEWQNRLKDTDAIALDLYGVSIPRSPRLAEDVAVLDLGKLKLDPFDELSEVFASGLVPKHIHVVVRIPQASGAVEIPQASGAWVYVVLSSLR
jgi:Crinkler effector protein N-terminal domain